MTSSRLRALVADGHPGPTATVNVVVTALAGAAGRDAAGLALVAAATLTGQPSVGWCDDDNDADRDRRASRTSKPTVRGDVPAAVLWRVAILGLVATVSPSPTSARP